MAYWQGCVDLIIIIIVVIFIGSQTDGGCISAEGEGCRSSSLVQCMEVVQRQGGGGFRAAMRSLSSPNQQQRRQGINDL